MEEIRAGTALVERASELLAERLSHKLAVQPRVSLALSGGRTPWPVFRALARSPLDWSRVDVYQVDERIAPAGDPARNLTGLAAVLLDRVDASAHPMPVEAVDLRDAAGQYAASLPDSLDIVQLGLGDDGHTASLVPGDPVLDVTEALVAVTQPYRGHRRMTLTFPALEHAASVVWIAGATGKADMLRRLRAGDPTIPAGRVPRARAVLVTDETGRA